MSWMDKLGLEPGETYAVCDREAAMSDRTPQPSSVGTDKAEVCICSSHWLDHGPFDCPHHGHVSEHLRRLDMSTIRDLTDREKAICRVALLAMAADETPFDIGEGFDPADPAEVEAVARLIVGATGIV